jgi:homogentisate 1,2-dioxygenase
MPHYRTLGQIPPKRHTVFRQPSGELYAEQLMGSDGFSGPASLLYHTYPPTRVLGTKTLRAVTLEEEPDTTLRMRHFHLGEVPESQSPSLDRTPVLFNGDVVVSVVRPTQTDEHFYRNGQGDEVVYVSEGSGRLESEFGTLAYRSGDYVVVPRGVLHRFVRNDESARMLIFESASRVRFPNRYMTHEGQLMEHAPYCERDLRGPTELETYNESGEFRVVVKQRNLLTEVTLDHHPLDVVGWDGCYYPYALSIHDFEPITGSLHQPPPVHQTFAADGFVMCSFVPRLFDFHPDAVPAPYNHANVMSDEVLFYANDEFMSRKGIAYGSLTVHPAGIPHGPHPGRAEASIGKQRTDELAVMIDTFRPLHVTRQATAVEDADYGRSWVTE